MCTKYVPAHHHVYQSSLPIFFSACRTFVAQCQIGGKLSDNARSTPRNCLFSIFYPGSCVGPGEYFSPLHFLSIYVLHIANVHMAKVCFQGCQMLRFDILSWSLGIVLENTWNAWSMSQVVVSNYTHLGWVLNCENLRNQLSL